MLEAQKRPQHHQGHLVESTAAIVAWTTSGGGREKTGPHGRGLGLAASREAAKGRQALAELVSACCGRDLR
eukprot:7778518-Pyramimonas_sp.AAC.1